MRLYYHLLLVVQIGHDRSELLQLCNCILSQLEQIYAQCVKNCTMTGGIVLPSLCFFHRRWPKVGTFSRVTSLCFCFAFLAVCFYARMNKVMFISKNSPHFSLSRSLSRFRGVVTTGNCPILSLAVIGHAKAGTSHLSKLLKERTLGIFRIPMEKEIGCLNAKVNYSECVARLGGPATCTPDGDLITNLTLDLSPLPLMAPLSKWSEVHSNENLRNLRPMVVAILRDPVETVESLYNMWIEQFNFTDNMCHAYPLENVIQTQLLYFDGVCRESYNIVMAKLRNGQITPDELTMWRDRVKRDYETSHFNHSTLKLPGIFTFTYLYVMEVMYEFEFLSQLDLLSRTEVLVVDFEVLRLNPNTVRNTILEMLLGSQKYQSILQKNEIPSWIEQKPTNSRPLKSECAKLSCETINSLKNFLKNSNTAFFKMLNEAADSRKLNLLGGRGSVWWNDVSYDCQSRASLDI